MTDPFEVTASETGIVRVFTTDLELQGDAAITPNNVQKLLGEGIELDPSKVEVFPSKMIAPVGFTTYLSEGHGIPESDLAGTAAALDALSGLVIVISSEAFKGQAVTLDPAAGIRLVGAFREPGTPPPRTMSEVTAAKGVLSPGKASADDPFVHHRRGWVLALAALLGAAALVLFAVF